MINCRAFIISASPLFVDAITHLLEEKGVEVVAQAKTITEAHPLLNNQQIDAIDAIIVDRNDLHLRDVEVASQLMDNNNRERKIVFLTMAGNEMVVYHSKRIDNVTPSDLVKTICVAQSKLIS